MPRAFSKLVDLSESVTVLQERTKATHGGDLKHAESMLAIGCNRNRRQHAKRQRGTSRIR